MGLYRGPQHKRVYTSEGLVSFGAMGIANIEGKAEEEILTAIKEGRLKGVCPVEDGSENGGQVSASQDKGQTGDETKDAHSTDERSEEKTADKADKKKRGSRK